jgi:hypothetical protein
MSEREKDKDQEREPLEDLEVPRDDEEDVKGGVASGDVNSDTIDGLAVDPNNPHAPAARRLPGLHKAGDVTLKRG